MARHQFETMPSLVSAEIASSRARPQMPFKKCWMITRHRRADPDEDLSTMGASQPARSRIPSVRSRGLLLSREGMARPDGAVRRRAGACGLLVGCPVIETMVLLLWCERSASCLLVG